MRFTVKVALAVAVIRMQDECQGDHQLGQRGRDELIRECQLPCNSLGRDDNPRTDISSHVKIIDSL